MRFISWEVSCIIPVAFSIACIGAELRGQSTVYDFSTFAGANARAESADGYQSDARFAFPLDMASDRAGNLYVADTGNAAIRKVTISGAVTTLAGARSAYGYQGGATTDFLPAGPIGIAVDASGNIYFSDSRGTISKLSTGGIVSTLAGLENQRGSIDGSGSQARFSSPKSLAISPAGDVYISDNVDNVIRKMTPAGVVTTFAGQAGESGSTDGPGNVARLKDPEGIVFDPAGNLYVADAGNGLIRKISSGGEVTTFARGDGGVVPLIGAKHLTIDTQGNVYVADAYQKMIVKILPSGAISQLSIFAGQPATSGHVDANGRSAQFEGPDGATMGPNGILYITDGNTIRAIDSSADVSTLAGSAGPVSFLDGPGTAARFYYPYGVATDASGNVFVADLGNGAIRKITPSGTVTTFAGGKDTPIDSPDALAVLPTGEVDATNFGARSVIRISPSGQAGVLIDRNSNLPVNAAGFAAPFFIPQGIAYDQSGNLYISDTGNNVIRKFAPDGTITNWAGSPDRGNADDGPGSSASFYLPKGAARDAAGNLYVADSGTHIIRKISPDGFVTTLAGLAFNQGFVDGQGSEARFLSPEGVAVDAAGNVFVADTGNHTIRRISPSGAVTTVAGQPGLAGNSNGVGNAARFNSPRGVAIDSAGVLYVADTNNSSIRKGVLTSRAAAPVISAQPQSQSVYTGSFVVLNVTATASSAVSYQWYWKGVPIPGATGSTFIIPSADTGRAGDYEVTVSNAGQFVTSAIATLTVDPNPDPSPVASQLTNLSTRSFVGQGASSQIAGFIIAGTQPKSVFIRASGPALTQFGVPGVLADPKLTLHSATSVIAVNDDWGSVPSEKSAISSIIAARNLFTLSDGSKDAAILATIPPGAYTAEVSGNNGATGVGIIEVYDLDNLPSQSKLTNISTRTEVRTGANIAIVGFIVSGSGPKTMLIRASGPSLAQFNVPGLLADPMLAVYSGQTVIAQNDDWDATDAASITGANQKTGAFAYPSGSKDSALVLTLPPGGYTAQVSGKNGTTGVALLEVFEVQ